MRLPNDEVERIAKGRRAYKDKRAREELAAIRRPDELTRLQGEVARLKLDLGDLRKRQLRLVSAASGVSGYAATTQIVNCRSWMEGLVRYINKYLEVVGDHDRVSIQEDCLVTVKPTSDAADGKPERGEHDI